MPGDRIERVKEHLTEQGMDAYIATGAADAAYLSGHYEQGPTGGDHPAVVVPVEGEPVLLVSPLSKDTAVREATIPVRAPDESLAETVVDLAGEQASLSAHASAQFHARLAEALDVTLEPDLLAGMRASKDEDEIKRIREAYRVTEEAIAAVEETIKAGVEERRIAAELEYAMRIHGSMGTGFPTIIGTDAFTAVPHHATSGAAIQEGPVLIDVGGIIDGYRSDMTRTFHVGQPSEQFIEVYEAVLEAHQEAASTLRASIPAKEVDAAARQVIEEAGFGDAFVHSTGHGVGLDVHERPNLSQKNDDPVPAGAVVTIEPGIYLEGRFGVRIEDAYRVTEEGGERLTTMDRSLDAMILERS